MSLRRYVRAIPFNYGNFEWDETYDFPYGTNL